MKTVILILFSLISVASAQKAPQEFERLETTNGKVYDKVKVRKIEPDGISIMHEAGTAKVAFTSLSTELQTLFGYDPEKAAEYRGVVEQQATRESLVEAENAAKLRLEKANYELIQAIKEMAIPALVKVQQNAGKGLCLCRWGEYVKTPVISTSGTSPREVGKRLTYTGEKNGTIAVIGLGEMADGESWKGTLYPCGVYTYESVGAGPRTVKRFATSAQVAFDFVTK